MSLWLTPRISGILGAGRADFAIAPVIRSNVPTNLRIIGVKEGLPVLPVSNVVLHKTKQGSVEIINCFSDHLIKFFTNREDGD